MSTKHALIVGINKYLHMAKKYQLHGCVNDAKLIRSILINKFNFDPANIIALYDEAATRDAILAEMDHIANKIEQDDILVFHYSGHGDRCITKTEHTEGSGKDNCILPTDDSELMAEGKREYREVRDDQFKEWLQRIAKKTPYTTLIFDSCHSGTMTRGGAGSTRVRTVPAEARPQAAETVRSTPDGANRKPIGEKPRAGGWLALSDNYVVISGCRDMQRSKERTFTKDGEKVRHGVLTYNLVNAMLGAKPGTTYRDVFELTCSGVVSQVSAQNPQIEGAIDRELFGVKDIEPLRYIPIEGVNGDKLTLDGGAAHGLRRGSKWAIYPPGTKQADNIDKIGTMQISKVGALSSSAVIIEGLGKVVVDARCVEIEAIGAIDPLLVDLSELNTHSRALMEPAIRRSRLLAVANSPDATDIQARIIESASSLPGNISAREKARIAGPIFAFFEDEDTLCMPLHPVNEPGVSKILLRNLEKIAKFRNVLRLDNPNSTLNVEFNLYKRAPDEELELANGGNFEFREDDEMVLEIKNNEEERPVFFSIIWINATREIMHFYPHRKSSEELAPGMTVRIGHLSNKLTVSLGDDFIADVGSETCKAIFSTTESDFSWLNQDGMRSGKAASSGVTAVDAALNGAAAAATGEERQDGAATPPQEDWDAVNRSYVLTRTLS